MDVGSIILPTRTRLSPERRQSIQNYLSHPNPFTHESFACYGYLTWYVYILEACKQPKYGIVKNGMVNTQGFEEEGQAFQTQWDWRIPVSVGLNPTLFCHILYYLSIVPSALD